METIDGAVEAIERRIQELCQKEIESRLLGEMVMDALRGIDKIAYVRFASVYREFHDVNQFVDTLESLDSGDSDNRAVNVTNLEGADSDISRPTKALNIDG
jgi:transcriptional repressor NrdR